MNDRFDPRFTSSKLANLLREFELTRELLLEIVSLPEDSTDAPADDAAEPLGDDEERLSELLRAVRQAVLQHPTVARAVVGWLVAEGRAALETTDGLRRYEAMVASPQVERLRTLWEKTTLSLLDDEDDPDPVPEAWVDLIRDLAAGSGLDRVAERLQPPGLR